MISKPSLGDNVFVLQQGGDVKSAIITALEPIQGVSCVKGKYSSQGGEELILLDSCYTTEVEALERAVENEESRLNELRKRLDEAYATQQELREGTAALILSMLTEADISSIDDLQIEDVHKTLIQRRTDIAPSQIEMLTDEDVTNFLIEHNREQNARGGYRVSN
jgi:lipopolysaccharide biosynthesis regulator YciM